MKNSNNPLLTCWNGEALMDAVVGEATYTPEKTTPPPEPAKAQMTFAMDGLLYTTTVTAANLDSELTAEHVAEFNEELLKYREAQRDPDYER